MARALGITVWKCDRCGRKSEQPGDRTPPGWATDELRPMGADESATDSWDVCENCANMVRRLLQPTDKPDNRSDLRSTVGSGHLREVELSAGTARAAAEIGAWSDAQDAGLVKRPTEL